MQKRADRADQSVLFFLAGANFWEKHAKNRRKHAKTGENTQKQAKNRRKTGAFLVLIFLGKKLVGANFYAFCNYVSKLYQGSQELSQSCIQAVQLRTSWPSRTFDLFIIIDLKSSVDVKMVV